MGLGNRPPSVSLSPFLVPTFHVLSGSALTSPLPVFSRTFPKLTLFLFKYSKLMYLSVFFPLSLQALLFKSNLLCHFTASSLLVILWILLFLSPCKGISRAFEYMTFAYKLQLLVLSTASCTPGFYHPRLMSAHGWSLLWDVLEGHTSSKRIQVLPKLCVFPACTFKNKCVTFGFRLASPRSF